MTLWSMLKICLRIKPVGAPCCTACGDTSCIVSPQTRSTDPARLRAAKLLCSRLLFDPTVEIFLRLHFEVRLHVVVPKAAKLGTNDFVFANFRGGEMDRQINAGHEILLDAQFRHKEGMSKILGMHEQMYFPVHGHGHLRGYNIVSGFGIVLRVEAEEVLVTFADVVGVQRAKLSMRARVAEVKGKLSRLHLDWHCIRGGWSEVHAGPGLSSEYAQSQYLRSY